MNSRKAFECIGLQCLHVRHCTTILHGKWNALPFTLIYPVCPCLSSLWLEVWILGFWLFGPGPVSPGLWQFPKSDELDISGQMDYKHHPATRNMSAVSGVCLNFSFIMFRKMFRKSLPNWVNWVNVLFWCWAFQKKGRSVFFWHPVIGQERLAPLAPPTSRLTPRTITGWWWLEPWNFEWLPY